MDIKLWFNEEMQLWRWTLLDKDMNMESGQQSDLRIVMNDIANTVEYITNKTERTEVDK
jgi:hypothetical protein